MRVGTQLLITTIGTIFLVLIVCAISYKSVIDLEGSHEWVNHTKSVLTKIESMLLHLHKASACSRDYMITGQKAFLDSFQVSAKRAEQLVVDLEQEVKDNPTQQERMRDVKALVGARIDAMNETLDIYERQGQQAAFDHLKKGVGSTLMTKVMNLCEEAKQEEITLLDKRVNEVHEDTATSLWTIIIGSFLTVSVVFFSNLFFSRNLIGCVKTLLRSADNIERGRFDATVAINSTDEFADLASAFNQLGYNLQAKAAALDEERQGRGVALKRLESIEKKVAFLSSRADDLLGKARQQMALVTQEHDSCAALKEQSLQVDASSAQIEELANSSVSAANRAVDIFQSLMTQCPNLVAAIEALSEEMELATQSSVSLSEFVSELPELVFTIENIAQELNMMGMMASMEISRMPQQSELMAPLIDKIKDLSQCSKADSVKVRQVIARLQTVCSQTSAANQDASVSTSTMKTRLTTIVNDLTEATESVREVQRLSSQIVNSTNRHTGALGSSRRIIDSIVGSVDEQKKALKQIELEAEEVQSVIAAADEILSRNGASSEDTQRSAVVVPSP
ncbi:MAG TPA: CHASE3 domain-containing protein [Candidatus Obscuribacterales bacterium]